MDNLFKIEVYRRECGLQQLIEIAMDRVMVEGYCKSCPRYGNCWSCPPFDFSIDLYLKNYSTVEVIAHKVVISKDIISGYSSSEEVEQKIKQIYDIVRKISDENIIDLERERANSVALFAGSCQLCEICAKGSEKGCCKALLMRRSLEAFGFDMSLIARTLFDTEIKWGSKRELPEYLFLISGLLIASK